MNEVLGVPGCWLLDSFMTKEECEDVIQKSEAAGFAPKKSKRPGPAVRDNMRFLYKPDELQSDRLQERLLKLAKGIIPEAAGATWCLPGSGKVLNEKWRINSYATGEVFRPHFDSGHSFSPARRTMFSLIIYLNDDFKGGETVFFPETPGRIPVPVKPKAGSALLFLHYGSLNPLHSTSPVVTDGRKKYIARTDIILEDSVFELRRLLFAAPTQVRKAVLLLGVSGSGKSSQLDRMSAENGWSTLNFGKCVRELKTVESELAKSLKAVRAAMANDTAVTKWLPDEISSQIFNECLPTPGPEILLLDGYPRKRSQSVQLESRDWLLLAAIYLKIPRDEQLARIAVREMSDRATEDVEVRMRDWERDTQPLIEHYRKRNELVEVDATQSVEAVGQEIENIVEQKMFDLIFKFVPEKDQDILSGYTAAKKNLSKKYRVYRFSRDLDELYLKVVYEPASRNPSSYEGPILAMVKEEQFPFETPVVRSSFAMGPEVNGVISERVPGITVKEVFKKKLAPVTALVEQWARALAIIHAFVPQHPENFLSRSVEDLLAIARQRISSGVIRASSFSSKFGVVGLIDLDTEINEVETRCRELTFDQIFLNHGDPCAPNFIWSTAKREITGCVDLSGIGFADIHWDLSIASWSLNYNTGTDLAREFHQHYVQAMHRWHGKTVIISPEKIDVMYRLARFLL